MCIRDSSHAVRTTEFYKDFPEDTPLEKMPVMNKETYRNHYEQCQSSVYKDASDNRITVSYTHLDVYKRQQ